MGLLDRFLLGQSFVPFPSALMGEYAANPLAVSFFGVVMAVNTLLFIAFHRYILRNLLKPEVVDLQVPHVIRQSFVGVLSYVIGAASAWVSVYAGFVLYLLTPLFFIVPPQPRGPRQPGTIDR